MIITRTPFRLSFFGGGTDYNSWFEEHRGLVVGCAFQQYCYISLRKLQPFFEHKSRLVYSKIERVGNNLEIEHPSVRACLHYLGIDEGLEIHHDGDLPARSGIGSSSSFTVGLLQGLHALRSQMVSKRTLAEQAIHVEQNVIGENVGIQDQTMAAYGGMQIIEMGPGNQFKVAPMILPSDYRKNFEQHVLLGFTGFTRTASEVAQGQIDNIKAGKSDVPLKAIYELAQEGLRLFTEGRPVSEIGRLIDQSWQIKRSLSTSISSEAMDEIYKTAMDAGAYGGRLMGAGGGGFMFFLAPPDRHNYIKYRLNQAVKVWVPFAIDDDGAQVILYRQ